MSEGAEGYTESFGMQWLRHSRTQLDSFTGLKLSEERLFATTGWPRDMRGQRILEAGCGAGRFTEILCKTGAAVTAFDASVAVEANRRNNGHYQNLALLRADILNPPFAEGSFEKVLCLGVLQHTPDPEASFHSLVRFVKPGGEIVADVYRKSLTALMCWKYLLRPVTRRLPPQLLYNVISASAPIFVPITAALRRLGGPALARLSPMVEYSRFGLASEVNFDWAVLDTFDMYSPRYDRPQSVPGAKKWLERAGLEGEVFPGGNGVIIRARIPESEARCRREAS
jgi:SAM-dependent methyltransferase